MGKILALDWGTKWIGYAVSDASAEVAFPRSHISAQPILETYEKLRAIAREEGISEVVLGVPLGRDDEETKASHRIRSYGEKLAHILMLPIVYVDEFGSTDEAIAKMPRAADRAEKENKDAIAAQIILQRYLDSRAREEEKKE